MAATRVVLGISFDLDGQLRRSHIHQHTKQRRPAQGSVRALAQHWRFHPEQTLLVWAWPFEQQVVLSSQVLAYEQER